MTFVVCYKNNYKPVDLKDFLKEEYIQKSNLMLDDLCGFLIDDNGCLYLQDDCNNIISIDCENKYVIQFYNDKNVLIDTVVY